MNKKRVTDKEGYPLPVSSEKGGQFVDFNAPYKSKVPVKRIVKVKRRYAKA